MEGGSIYLISQGLFIKACALIYLVAFASLGVQVKGLYGTKGIAPIDHFLNQAGSRYRKKELYLSLPTIFWINSSDRALRYACWAGAALALLAMLGMYPAICFIGLWVLYFSFCSVGAPFLNFQWDVLLLEVGCLAFLFSIQSPPPVLLVYLLWFVLFRFLFSSGFTKLVWGSKEWRDLTAMDYHYETQPLPTRIGYYAHHLPKFLSKLSTLGTYFFELIVPLFIFSPEEIRVPIFFLCVLFQIFITLTGNFAFFNYLTIAMCIPLIPDGYLHGFENIASFTPLFQENIVVYSLLTMAGAYLFFLNALELLVNYFKIGKIYRLVVPFRQYNLINPYGLFVHMTTKRDEIIIEGSEDGNIWKPYSFKWKPQDLEQPPKLVAPHQPRLDWQMWFAALSSSENNPWLIQLLFRLLEGSDDVLGLFGNNPFAEKPPKYIRARLYRYHFTDLKTKRETGKWWTRQLLGDYTPVFEAKS